LCIGLTPTFSTKLEQVLASTVAIPNGRPAHQEYVVTFCPVLGKPFA
jgi:hypothetical protein